MPQGVPTGRLHGKVPTPYPSHPHDRSPCCALLIQPGHARERRDRLRTVFPDGYEVHNILSCL
eukprot:8328389-Pyramimonas_sp.AAC.1